MSSEIPDIDFTPELGGIPPQWAAYGENQQVRAVGGGVLQVLNSRGDFRDVMSRVKVLDAQGCPYELASIIPDAQQYAIGGVSFQLSGDEARAKGIFGGGLQSNAEHGHGKIKQIEMAAWGHGNVELLKPGIQAIADLYVKEYVRNHIDNGEIQLEDLVGSYLDRASAYATGIDIASVHEAGRHSAYTTGSLRESANDFQHFHQAWFGSEIPEGAWFGEGGQYHLSRNIVGEQRRKIERGEGKDALFSRMLRLMGGVAVDGTELTDDTMLGEIATVINGLATTKVPLMRGTMRLAELPAYVEDARKDPLKWQSFTYELLRFDTFTNGLPRLMRADYQLKSGHELKANDVVLPSNYAAAQDPVIFAKNRNAPGSIDPGEFHPYEQAHRGVVFNLGLHACTGEWLAVAEMSAFYKALFSAYDVEPAKPFATLDFEAGTVPIPVKPTLRLSPRQTAPIS